MKTLKIISFIVGMMLLNHSVFAETSVESTSSTDNTADNEYLDMPLEELLQVDIYATTASKILENVNKTVATISVIEQKQIQEMGARNLLDVLKLVPGIGVTQSFLGIRQIEVRGISTITSDKVLFMLNGHPLDHDLQIAGGTWDYDDLPVDTIQRVEIVRGTGSALYGANAFMAVINIITQNAKDLNGFHASAKGGSFGTKQLRTSWGKQFDNSFSAALHFNFADTNGIATPLYTDKTQTMLGKSQLFEERKDFEWQLGYKNFKFEGRYIDKKGGTFFGTGSVLTDNRTFQDYENYFLKLSHKWQLNELLTVDTQVFHDSFGSIDVFQLAPANFILLGLHDTRTGGEIQTTYKINDSQTLITGFSAAKEAHGDLSSKEGTSPENFVSVTPTSPVKSRTRWGVYAQDVFDPFKNIRLTLGARYDEYSDFGGTFNPRIGFNWEFVKNYSLKFSYGTAYRAPVFGELYLTDPILKGNSTLTPEKIKTFEGGIITHPLNGLTAQATYYYSSIDKIISIVGTTAPLHYANNGKITAQGVELEGRYDFNGNLKGSYFSVNSVWQHSMQDGRQLADVPQYRTNVMANWAIDKTWSAYSHVLVKSNTSRALGDMRADVPGYTVVDLGVVGKNIFNQNFDLGFNVYNLFNKRYYDPSLQSYGFAGDYQAAGISYFGHIALHF